MRIAAACLSLIALAGCPKAAGLDLAGEVLAAPPHLPSPRAGTYARVPDNPSDPVVAALTGDLRWDASLSGAAAGLALDLLEDEGSVHAWYVRQKAWEAGYPYPVSAVKVWSTPPKSPPPADLLAWLATLDRSVDLGLVRARDAREEVWLALVATPRASIGIQPRQVDLGHTLTLPTLPGARYAIVDSAGKLYEGGLDIERQFTLDVGGEWLFQVSDDRGVAAKFPVYVNMVPPELGLLEPSDAPATDDEAIGRARDLMLELREAYGLGAWQDDALLGAAARSMLEGDTPLTRGLAEKVGFASDRLWRIECRAVTVEDCVDRMIWNPWHRAAIVSGTSYWGVAARREQPGVRIVALVAAD